MATTKDELFHLHQVLCGEALDLMHKKNADYSGGAEDPFANFRGSEQFGIAPELGIIVRIGDKFKRIEAFIKTGDLAVKEESVRDCCVDAINYVVLMAGLLIERIDGQKNS